MTDSSAAEKRQARMWVGNAIQVGVAVGGILFAAWSDSVVWTLVAGFALLEAAICRVGLIIQDR